jgi:THUMP domain-like
LRAALRERSVGRLTIKKRGVAVAPEQLRKALALQGDQEATIVLTRVAGKGTCLLVRPF